MEQLPNITIGITGGIGSGKSVVSRILRCNGYRVYDCDYEAKYLMVNSKEIKEKLISGLGEEIYEADGGLNKKAIANALFSDPLKGKYINHVVHTAVREDIVSERDQIQGYFFIESAILASGGIQKFCDKIWLVTAPDNVRIRRVEQRDNLEKSEIYKRIHAQAKEENLLQKDKIIFIDNDNNHEVLKYVLDLMHSLDNFQTYKILC